LDIDNEDIIYFLNISYPEIESILVGCRSESCNSYECCEYDIIVLGLKNRESNSTIRPNKKIIFHKLGNKYLEILFLNKEGFFQNKDINFLNYTNLTNSIFKLNMESYFEKRKYYNQKNFNVFTKRKSLQFALDYIKINKQIINHTSDQILSSFYLKMMSFNVIEILIQLFSGKNPKPTHLKYQINDIKENSPRIKEYFDILSEYLELERSNISTITRSEKSLIFLLKHNKCDQQEIELLLTKLNFFKKKSMYVDANLLVHNFIKKQNFDRDFIKNYSKLLSYILDIQIKEKTILLKEFEILFNINNNIIKNNY
jgi:hypothetical protein